MAKESWLATASTLAVCVSFTAIYASGIHTELGASQTVLWITGSVLEVSQPFRRRMFARDSFKVFVGVYLLCFFVVTTSYRGCLISFITVPFVQAPMDSVVDVVEVETNTTNTVSTNFEYHHQSVDD